MSGLKEPITVQQDGVVHLPVVARSRPGHPHGSWKLFDCPLEGKKNKHMLMTPGSENVVIEFTLKSDLLKFQKQYNLSMRFQTHQEQPEPLHLKVKRGKSNSPVVYETQIPLPNTNGQWQTMNPVIALDSIEIGGSPDTLLEFTHPCPAGKGIAIRDFSLIPLCPSLVGECSTSWWRNWMETTTQSVKEKLLPQLDVKAKESFVKACQEEANARKKQEQAKGEEAQKEAKKEHQSAQEHTFQMALPLLDAIDPELESINLKSENCKQLLQCMILQHATPDRLAHYCSKAEQNKKRMHQFLENMDQMLLFLKYGGAKDGCYPRALEICEELQEKQQQQIGSNDRNKSVLPRLALACALELCKPLSEFNTPNIHVDPIQRYFHYEKAYLDRELDPAFETFSTWELRHVVNSEAPNEQLAWCREMIRNYNPQIAIMDDMHWRYCWITRSDCHYKKPEWTRKPHCFRQLISGGGMCGPRAWMGRFACRAFGHPVWGVRQKGHAAVLRWEPKGWNTSLGCGIDGSWWEDRRARDFVNEAKVRKQLGDEGYLRRAELLDYFSFLLGEKNGMYVSPNNNVWHSLAIMQRKRLAESEETAAESPGGSCEVYSLITELRERQDATKETVTVSDDGSITIPVAARVAGKKVQGMKSYLGGTQVNLKGADCELQFRIPAELIPHRKSYNLTARVVTIHENDPYPMLLCIQTPNEKHTLREYSVPLPYSAGKWCETSPVKVELGGNTEILKINRKSPTWAFTLKDLQLTPAN